MKGLSALLLVAGILVSSLAYASDYQITILNRSDQAVSFKDANGNIQLVKPNSHLTGLIESHPFYGKENKPFVELSVPGRQPYIAIAPQNLKEIHVRINSNHTIHSNLPKPGFYLREDMQFTGLEPYLKSS